MIDQISHYCIQNLLLRQTASSTPTYLLPSRILHNGIKDIETISMSEGEGNQALHWPLRSISPVLWQREDTAHGMQPLCPHCHNPHWLDHTRNRHTQNPKQRSNTPQDGKMKPSRKAAGHLKSFLSSPWRLQHNLNSPSSCAALWKQQRPFSTTQQLTSPVSIWQTLRTQWWETDFPIKCSWAGDPHFWLIQTHTETLSGWERLPAHPRPLSLCDLKGVRNEQVYKLHSENLAGNQSNSSVDHWRGVVLWM